MAQTNKQCSICGKTFLGYGNNAMPVNEGVCCDECNIKFVLPSRWKEMMRGRK